MKKLLGLTLALAMLFPYSQASAELLKNLKVSGQLDIQATAARNTVDFATRANPLGAGSVVPASFNNNDRISDTQTRLMVNLDWDLLDDVHSKVTLRKNNRVWGTGGVAGSDYVQGTAAAGGSETLSTAGSNVLGRIAVDQANVKIDKLAGDADVTVGRQFFGDSGDLIIYFGPSDKAMYGMNVTAIDAARFDWANDNMGLTALVGKTSIGAGVGGIPQNSINVRGLVLSCKRHENVHPAVYLWNRQTQNGSAAAANGGLGAPSSDAAAVAGGKNDNLYVLGAKVKATMGGAWVKGEIAKNFGDNRVAGTVATHGAKTYTGFAFLLNGGYKAEVNGVGAVTPWGEFGYGTGAGDRRSATNEQFTAIAGDYRPGSISGRFTNASGAALGALVPNGVGATGISPATLSNAVLYGFGVKVNPASLAKLTAGLSYWDFSAQKLLTAEGNRRPLGGNKHVGSEVDLDFEWKHSDNIGLGFGWGTYQPGGLIKEGNQSVAAGGGTAVSQQPTNPATLAYMDMRVRF
ncbi:MAG: hypothetical protein HY921_09560 [Elusimicrobia bacterium]|nr:hypothetical protein [Elusimicrobiota bacterium]